MPLEIHRGELAHDDVQALLADHVAAMRACSPLEACHVLPGSALDDPAITFFTARRKGRLLGMAALKVLADRKGEVKSMRTAPAALRQGVAAALLEALVAVARERSCDALLLETGSGPEFEPASRLYDRAGFRPCGPFGGYSQDDFTRFLRLDL